MGTSGNPPAVRAQALAVALAAVVGVMTFWSAVTLAGAEGATIEAKPFTTAVPKPGTAPDGGGFARCGPGRRAVGGGVVQSGSPSGIRLHESGPLDATSGTLGTRDGDVAKRWYAYVRNDNADDRIFKVFAICSGNSTATIEATQFRLDSGEQGEGFARCGPGRRALGGGVLHAFYPDNTYVQASGPLDASGLALETRDGDVAKQWYASVISLSVFDDMIVRVYAICAGNSNATIEAKQLTTGPGTVEAFVHCGPGRRALGGGVVQIGSPDEVFVRTSGPLDSSGSTLGTTDGDVAKQWYSSVSNNSGEGTPDRTFKAFAICV